MDGDLKKDHTVELIKELKSQRDKAMRMLIKAEAQRDKAVEIVGKFLEWNAFGLPENDMNRLVVEAEELLKELGGADGR